MTTRLFGIWTEPCWTPDAILAGEETYARYGWTDRASIHSYILKHLSEALGKVASEEGLGAAEMNAFRGAKSKGEECSGSSDGRAAESLAWKSRALRGSSIPTGTPMPIKSWKTWGIS